MGPSMHVDIASLLRALQETIIPALPASASLAVEQAHLMRLYLQRLDQQSEYFLHAKLHELTSCFRLLRELRAIADASALAVGDAADELLEEAAALAEVALPSYQEVERVADALREHAEQYYRQLALVADDPQTRRAIHEALMTQALDDALRERVWNKSAGFDVDPQALPSTEHLFNGGA